MCLCLSLSTSITYNARNGVKPSSWATFSAAKPTPHKTVALYSICKTARSPRSVKAQLGKLTCKPSLCLRAMATTISMAAAPAMSVTTVNMWLPRYSPLSRCKSTANHHRACRAQPAKSKQRSPYRLAMRLCCRRNHS